MECKGLTLSFLAIIVFTVILVWIYMNNRKKNIETFKEVTILARTISSLHHDSEIEFRVYGFAKMTRKVMKDVTESIRTCPVCKANQGTLLIEAEKIIVNVYNKEKPELESENHNVFLSTLSQISGDLK